ncbi:MAG: hypothetical protein QXL34_06545 [Thermosphaera sp.]
MRIEKEKRKKVKQPVPVTVPVTVPVQEPVPVPVQKPESNQATKSKAALWLDLIPVKGEKCTF